MGWLSDPMNDVKSLLTSNSGDWSTWDWAPERIPAPCIAIMLGSPSIEDGTTFGDMLARWTVTLIPEIATNEKIQTDLVALIETSVARLLDAGYGVEQVGQPYVLEANNARYVAVDITITQDVQPEIEGETP